MGCRRTANTHDMNPAQQLRRRNLGDAGRYRTLAKEGSARFTAPASKMLSMPWGTWPQRWPRMLRKNNRDSSICLP
jgi:hypothetical protein